PPILLLTPPRPQRFHPFPYTTLFRSRPPRSRRHTSRATLRSSHCASARLSSSPGRPRRIPCCSSCPSRRADAQCDERSVARLVRSEEHTSELQSRRDIVCRSLLEK